MSRPSNGNILFILPQDTKTYSTIEILTQLSKKTTHIVHKPKDFSCPRFLSTKMTVSRQVPFPKESPYSGNFSIRCWRQNVSLFVSIATIVSLLLTSDRTISYRILVR